MNPQEKALFEAHALLQAHANLLANAVANGANMDLIILQIDTVRDAAEAFAKLPQQKAA